MFGVDLLMFFHTNERQLEKNSNDKLVSYIQTEYSQKDINTKERREKVVGHIHNKYGKKVMNKKERHEKVVGHLQTKYDKKVKHHDKLVDKLNTKHYQKKMNMMYIV